jgi:hypothetical protein
LINAAQPVDAILWLIPITLEFGVLAEKLFHSDIPVFVFPISWMLLFAIAGVRYNMFP